MNSTEGLDQKNSFVPVRFGIFETEELYCAVLFKRGNELRVMIYVTEGGELYDRPIAAFEVTDAKRLIPVTLTKFMRAVCRSFASGGLSVKETRDLSFDFKKMANGAYYGDTYIYGEHKR